MTTSKNDDAKKIVRIIQGDEVLCCEHLYFDTSKHQNSVDSFAPSVALLTVLCDDCAAAHAKGELGYIAVSKSEAHLHTPSVQ